MTKAKLRYIGTKIIVAVSMTRGEYNTLRGWELPKDENGDDEGFLVEYEDGGKPNLIGYDGYVSWSPAEQFHKAYRLKTGLTFGMAIEALKKGLKVARLGWNGKDMFIFLVPGSKFNVSRPPLLGIYPEGEEVTYRPHVDMYAADGTIGTWSASPSDILAEDWVVVQ